MAKALLYPSADRSHWFGDKFDGRIFTDLDKLLLHSTETDKRWGCPGYSNGSVGPTLTVNPWPGYRHVWQHFNLNESARALMDPASTAALENKDNVCQIEIVGYSDKGYGLARGCYLPNLDADSRQWLANVFAFIMREWTIPNVWASPFPWPLYPASYGNTSSRMTSSEYDRFTGVLGHLHASGNDHGDPSLPVADLRARVGALLTNTPTAAKDWFDMASIDDLKNALKDPDVLREVARFVLTGYAFGPDGEQKVLAGWVTQNDALARIAIQAASDDLTAEQVQAAVEGAIASGAQVTGDLKVVPKAVQ